MSKLAPIVLFVYNRPWHTRQTLEALMANKLAAESILYIFCDGPKDGITSQDLRKIQEVRNLVKEKNWCGSVKIFERESNLGLADSVILGVTSIINKYEKVIVLEDDIKVEPFFLNYMNEGLVYYKNKKKIYHINGFNNESKLQFILKDFYFLNFMSCWGWATWIDRWQEINKDYMLIYKKLKATPATLKAFNYDHVLNFHEQLEANIEGKIKTWAILWYSTIFLQKGLCLTPKYSLVENIGMDGTGVHCVVNNLHAKRYSTSFLDYTAAFKEIKLEESFRGRLHLKAFYRFGNRLNFSKISFESFFSKNFWVYKKLSGINRIFKS